MANCINDKAVILEAEGQTADYLQYYMDALELFERAHPNGHPEMVATLGNIGYELRKRGKESEAEKVLRRAVSLAERIMLPQHEYSAFARWRLTTTLLAQRRYDEAMEVMRRHVDELERFPGPDHEDTSQARLQSCRALLNGLHLADPTRSTDYREQSRTVSLKIRFPDPRTVLGLLDLADDARLIGETGLHDSMTSTALRGCRAFAEKHRDKPAEAVSLRCFANVVDCLMSGVSLSQSLPEAARIWEQAQPDLRPQGDRLPRTRKLIVEFIAWYARSCLDQRDDVQGIKLAFEEISRIGAEIPETLDHLASLAVALKRRQYYEDCQVLCEKLLAVSERVLGSDHSQTLTYLSNLAWLREYCGQFEDAEKLFRRAFVEGCRVLGVEHSKSIGAASSLIACLLRMGNKPEAARLSAEFAAKLPESTSLTSGRKNFSLSLNQRAIGLKDEFAEYEHARACYDLSLDVADDATTRCNLALLLWSCIGDSDSAALEFERSLALDPASGHIHSTYAMFLTHTRNDPRKALEHFKESMRLSPNENHIPGNFATWYILAGDLSNAWQMAKLSMKLCLPHPDRVMARPLFCAITIALLNQQEPLIALGQMKALFNRGISHVAWIVTALLDHLDHRLSADRSGLLRAICDAIADKQKVALLDAHNIWRETQPESFEAGWPEPRINSRAAINLS